MLDVSHHSDEEANNHHATIGTTTPGGGATSTSRVASKIGQIGKASGNLMLRITKGLNPLNLKNVIVGENVDQTKLKPRTHEFI